MTAARCFVVALTVTLCSFARAQDPAPRGQARSEAVSWSGCQVVELDGTVREVRCPDFALRLLQAASLSDAASLAALVSAFPEGADARPGELRVGRSTVPTMESRAMLFAVPYPGAQRQ